MIELALSIVCIIVFFLVPWAIYTNNTVNRNFEKIDRVEDSVFRNRSECKDVYCRLTKLEKKVWASRKRKYGYREHDDE